MVAVLDAHFEVEERWRIIAGTVCATIRNAQRTKQQDKVWTWEDWFPRTKKHSPAWQTAEELDLALQGFDAYGRAKKRQLQQQNGKAVNANA